VAKIQKSESGLVEIDGDVWVVCLFVCFLLKFFILWT